MAKVNPGKRFEREFKKSMDAAGYAMRIHDRCFLAPSGRLVSEPSEADFVFFAANGHSYLIECKATHTARLPYDNVRPEQISELERFEAISDMHHSIIAVNFYGESTRQKNDLYLVGLPEFKGKRAATLRKSLSEREAEAIGYKCERQKGAIWGLPLQKEPPWESTCTDDLVSAKNTAAPQEANRASRKA